MINVLKKEECTGCHACENICPKQCISMVSDDEGFWYPVVDIAECVNCGLCETVCPINVSHDKTDNTHIAYAAINTNEDIRKESSSGGIFSLIAEWILEQGGVVFGAAFDDDFNVIHRSVDTVDELYLLRGSKYVQSKIGDTYKQAKDYLEQGRKVLFTGTPCQIGGLLTYLNKPYEELYTQDIICHGVPSPAVWKRYVEYRSKEARGAIPRRIAFREKHSSWKRFSVSFYFQNDTEYRDFFDKDPMMKAFLKNLCLRPSCYACAYKSKQRLSDITLADFWGIENIDASMFDDKGTSLVIVHTLKGQKLLNELSGIDLKEENLDLALKYNSAMVISVARNANRDKFIADAQKYNFAELEKSYLKESWVALTKRKIKRVIKFLVKRK